MEGTRDRITRLRVEGNRWLYPSEAAEILGCSIKTLSRWENEGKLATHGIHVQRTLGGHRRYHRPDLERLARTLTVQVEEMQP